MVMLAKIGTALTCVATFLTLVLLALLGGLAMATAARGDDKGDRERKVKVALALSGADFRGPGSSAAAVAPPPRVPAPKNYAEGYRDSLAGQVPLVVYVGCTGPKIDGAATVRTDSYPGVTGPAVVVGYPVGDRLIQDRTLPGTATTEEVTRAARDAARKVAEPMPKDKPVAPAPLDWMIGAHPAPV